MGKKAVLSHGIRNAPWRTNPMKPMYDYLHDRGLPVDVPELGYVLVPVTNNVAVRRVLDVFENGDVLVGYSNGCYANALAIDEGARPSAVVNISAALDRDWVYPRGLPVYNFYCPDDNVLTLGHWYSSIVSWMPWRLIKGADGDHGWGDAGKVGLNNAAINIRLPYRTMHSWYKDPEAVVMTSEVVSSLLQDTPA